MPPPGHGEHRYFFRLYALEMQMGFKPGWDKRTVLDIIRDHVLGDAVLMGTYVR